MTIKSILVPLDGSDESFAVLDTALVIANRFEARIKAIHVRPISAESLPFQFDPLPAKLKKSVIQETEKQSKENARQIRNQFVVFCKNHKIKIGDSLGDEGVGAIWHDEMGDTVEVLVRHGRLCDVIATFRPRKSNARLRRSPAGANLEALMLRAGRPILMVPPRWAAHKVGHAAIAWNESLEVSRALAMTMPWLVQMDQVTVIVSKKRKGSVPDLRDYLSLHGVKSKVKYLPAKAKSVGEAILDCCTENGVEFLVVGGFSRTRSRQLLFGGVTHHLLMNSSVITVMVH